jgi:hypothetical protein
MPVSCMVLLLLLLASHGSAECNIARKQHHSIHARSGLNVTWILGKAVRNSTQSCDEACESHVNTVSGKYECVEDAWPTNQQEFDHTQLPIECNVPDSHARNYAPWSVCAHCECVCGWKDGASKKGKRCATKVMKPESGGTDWALRFCPCTPRKLTVLVPAPAPVSAVPKEDGYICLQDKCVLCAQTGCPNRTTCEKLCLQDLKWVCIGGQCVPYPTGLLLTTCQAGCGPARDQQSRLTTV